MSDEGWIAVWLVVGVGAVVAWVALSSWLWDQWWDERWRAQRKREREDEEREDL